MVCPLGIDPLIILMSDRNRVVLYDLLCVQRGKEGCYATQDPKPKDRFCSV